MKRITSSKQIVLVALTIMLTWGSSQLLAAEGRDVFRPDTRVWCESYWLDMAGRGLVEVAPVVPVEKAVYRSSMIDAPGLLYVDSPDVPVSSDASVTQSENSVFVNPADNSKVLNSNNSSNWPMTSFYGADALMTSDGGSAWTGSVLGVGGYNSGDPSAAIGLNGRYYVGYVSSSYAQGLSYSTNEGVTWSTVSVAGGGYILDKEHLWVDNSTASPYEGNLYDAWTNFQGGGNYDEIELVRSTDDGAHWSSRINISSGVSAGSHNQGVNIQTGPNGEVYAVWAIYDSWPSDEPALGFAKSTDGGASFSTAERIITNIRGIRASGVSKNMRVNSFPVMAADISNGPDRGNLYVVWANIGIPGINTGSDIDIYMIRSTDGGSSWSTPVRVNQDATGQGNEHYFPWISCDPATGNLCVVFYDDRNVTSNKCEVFTAISEDAGATWTDFRVSDVSFTPSPIPGLASGYFGDYLGMSIRDGRAYPTWTDNRDGRAMTYVSAFDLGLPIPDVKIDGLDNPPSVPSGQVVDLSVALDPGDQDGVQHDWWLSAERSGSTWWYEHTSGTWTNSMTPIRASSAPLMNINNFNVASGALPAGIWTFTFTIDALNDTYEGTYVDMVTIKTY